MTATDSEPTLIESAASSLDAVLRTVFSPRGMIGLAGEVAWNVAHLAMYPYGLLRDDSFSVDRAGLKGLDPLRRGMYLTSVEAAGTPIILLHGLVDNRSIMQPTATGLRRKGFTRLTSVNYPVLTGDVRLAARRFADTVERICDESDFDQCHIIGHSLGGLIARYYVQRLGGAERVRTLVTLGSPHGGTVAAHLWSTPLIRSLRPGSDLLTELAEPALDVNTRLVCYWSDIDHVVLPVRNARCTHPDLDVVNVLVRGVGHMSLPMNGHVIHDVARRLRGMDPETPHFR